MKAVLCSHFAKSSWIDGFKYVTTKDTNDTKRSGTS